MNDSQPAWIIATAGGGRYAVADHEMLEFVDHPVCHPVPLATAHCNQLVYWRGQLVPRFDLDALLGEACESRTAVAIVAYQPARLQPLRSLALCVACAPQRVLVDDSRACALPMLLTGKKLHAKFALAAFDCDGSPVVVVDVARLAATGELPPSQSRGAAQHQLAATA